jgi:hypothetical protein
VKATNPSLFVGMEFLLNLAWLLLALPGYWLWRGARAQHSESPLRSLQCVIALGCLLVILFPVISATDDLVAARTEMEESGGSRNLRQSDSEKAGLSRTGVHPVFALLASEVVFALASDHISFKDTPGSVRLAPAPALPPGRAPPSAV